MIHIWSLKLHFILLSICHIFFNLPLICRLYEIILHHIQRKRSWWMRDNVRTGNIWVWPLAVLALLAGCFLRSNWLSSVFRSTLAVLWSAHAEKIWRKKCTQSWKRKMTQRWNILIVSEDTWTWKNGLTCAANELWGNFRHAGLFCIVLFFLFQVSLLQFTDVSIHSQLSYSPTTAFQSVTKTLTIFLFHPFWCRFDAVFHPVTWHSFSQNGTIRQTHICLFSISFQLNFICIPLITI